MGANEWHLNYESGILERMSLGQDPRVPEMLKKYFDHVLQKVLKSRFPGIDVRTVRETSLIKGATSAVTVQIAGAMEFLLKLDIATVPGEIEGYRIMEHALPNHTLELLYHDANAGLLCVPYLATGESLHDIIKDSMLSERDILTAYADFLRQILALWHRTYLPRRPSYESHFVYRLRDRTRKMERRFATSFAGQEPGFSRVLRLPLRIHGVEYPPLAELLDRAVHMILKNPAPFSVTAHRDEHAKNILVDLAARGDIPRWYLVDLPNVSTESDWIWSIAKMRHWWLAYYHVDQARRLPPSGSWLREVQLMYEVRDNQVVIDYDMRDQIPPICRALDQKVADFAKQTGRLLKDRGWPERYRASLFLTFYGGIPYHSDCQHVIPILLGESVKALYSE